MLVPAVLCTRWTAMTLERVNSKAGIIITRLRANMEPEMAERLITGVEWTRKACGPNNMFISNAEAAEFASQMDQLAQDNE